MSVILTGGQTYDQIAAAYTLAPEYGVAIQNYNNMQGQDIAGKKFRLEIPDSWMKPGFAGKQIDLRGAAGVMSPWVWGAVAVGVLLLVK